MASLYFAFLQVLPVFLVIALGHGLRRIGLCTEAFTEQLSRLVFYVLMPPLLFLSVTETELARSFEPRVILPTLALVTLFTGAVFLGSARWLGPTQRGVFSQGAARANLMFLGLPILLSVYGDSVLGSAAVFIACHALLINLLAVLILLLPHYPGGGREVWKKMAAQILLNPIVLGCAAGIVAALLGYRPTGVLKATMKSLASATIPLALLLVGASLRATSLKGYLGLVSLTALLKLLVLPLLTYLLLEPLGVPRRSLVMAVVLLGAPTAVTSHIMAREMRGDEALASAMVMVTTLLSPLTLTAWIGLLS